MRKGPRLTSGDRRRRRSPLGALLLALLACSCSQSQSTCPPRGSAAPLQASPTVLGAKWDWGTFIESRPYLESLPGGATYYEVVWCDVEKSPGSLDWHTVDSVVERAAELDFSTLLKIRVGQCWTTDKDPQFLRGKKQKTESSMPTDLDRYSEFVTSVVKRYSPMGVHEFAVENEVNSPGFWDSTPEDYQELVNSAASAIRCADSEAIVVDSGISSVATGYGVVRRLLEADEATMAVDVYNLYFARRFGTRGEALRQVADETQLRAVLTSPDAIRALSFLDATDSLLEDGVVDVRQAHFYEQSAAMPYFLDYLQATTPRQTPIELWELGSFLRSTLLPDRQRAADVVKATVTALSRGVTTIVWLPLSDNPLGRVSVDLYGLLGHHAQPRAASDAFALLSEAATEASTEPVAAHGLVGAGFERNGQTTLIVWAEAAPVRLALPAGSQLRELAVQAQSAPVRSASVGYDPVLITLPMTTAKFLDSLS